MTPQQTHHSPQRSLSLVLIGAVLGGMAGFLYAAGAGITLDGHDHASDHGQTQTATPVSETGHSHGYDEMADIGTTTASLVLMVKPDTVSGYNLTLETTGFRFAPEKTGAGHSPGEGHAHLYIDGAKIGRIYAAYHHLGGLAKGTHEIKVTLNANDHRLLAYQGKPLEDTLMITVD